MAQSQSLTLAAIPAQRTSRRQRLENILWYFMLSMVGIITVLPFLWIFLASFKGPNDAVVTLPPQFIPRDPTLANYRRVFEQLPIWRFFLNSITVALCTVGLNVLISALAAYPLAKMRFRGRDLIFFALLATFIVPRELTYIPSFVLAVNVFHYYDTLRALILPNMVGAFNIFFLRQAFKTIPNELIDAAKMDGASELRLWWQILLPIIRPSLATIAINTFVVSWNDFLWPSLMLHTRELMTLPVGLIALQGMFQSDFRATAAGVTITVIPILVFFILLQRQFVRGLAGAVKG